MHYATPCADAYDDHAAEHPERRRIITPVRLELRRLARHAARSGDELGARRLRDRLGRITADYAAWLSGDLVAA